MNTPDPAASLGQLAAVAGGLAPALPGALANLGSLAGSAATLAPLAQGAVAAIPIAGEVMAGVAVVTAGENLAEHIIDAKNTPIEQEAALESAAQKAKDRLAQAIQNKDLATLQRLAQP